jgi:subtilisin family serine protease
MVGAMGGARLGRGWPAIVAGAALLAFLGAPSAAAAGRADYIVVFKPGVDHPAAVAKQQSRRFGVEADFVYGAALDGYAGSIPRPELSAVRADRRVAFVERDQRVSTLAKSSAKPGGGGTPSAGQILPWGIDRIDADLSSTLAGNGSGAVGNVNAYVIDTGIDSSHRDLNVVASVNFAGGKNGDCNGHGTHVAGTIAARDNAVDVVGAAPGAPLTAVKVLGCGGSGTTSGVIAGINWVTAHAVRPAIANLSLGGGVSDALDDAVRNSASSGIVYSIAAGNDGVDACNSSPARAGAGFGSSE